jgi:hypothetical protein
MPELLQLLRAQDLGYARIVAELWGLEVIPNDLDAGLDAAAGAMLDGQLVAELVEALDPEGREALMALARAGGRMPWNAFTRRFGEVRDMGAGRRDREHPQLHPASAAEALFYRAMLGRAFFETDGGPQEFAYVPDELLGRIAWAEEASAPASPPGRAATPAERSHTAPASDRILDEATTFLAAIRAGEPIERDPVLSATLECAGVLHGGVPEASRVKTWLEAPRAEALRMLVVAWRACGTFDELRLLPGLTCEGPWTNQPQATRTFLLRQLAGVPAQTWWNLKSFVESIKEQLPDFQRPAGDYDSWFIKRQEDGRYLRGFESWNEVDGALIRFMITSVLPRLGLIDIGAASSTSEPLAFRRAPRRRGTQTEDGKLDIGSQGRISAGREAPRAVRYQLARFCEWETQGPDEYIFRITPRALERASKQGLKVEHLLALLARHGKAGIPASVTKALKRWEQSGTEARTETQVVLRVTRPEIIKELQKSRAGRFLDQALGPTAITIKPGAQDKVISALAEMGLLGQDESGGPHSGSEPPAKVERRDDKRKAGAKITSRK